MRALVLGALLGLVAALPVGAQEPPIELQKKVTTQEPENLEPGYAMGDVTVAAPEIADVKVQPGRRQLTIVGKEAGQTQVTIWDQRGVKRHEIQVTVVRRGSGAVTDTAPEASPGRPKVAAKGASKEPPREPVLPDSGDLLEVEKTLFVREQQLLETPYQVGDVAIGAPEVADFKVLEGRRQILMFGRASGRTNMTIWDHNRARRHEVWLTVMTREEAQAETELRDLLKEFRSVQVRWIRGRLTAVGTVASAQELEDLGRILQLTGAMSLVRVGRPAPSPPRAQGPSEAELLERLVREFPHVRVGRLSGQLYISGAVGSDQDLEIVRRMANALGAQTIVNVRPDARK
jgi:Flp pilus assembly secretin CpaC